MVIWTVRTLSISACENHKANVWSQIFFLPETKGISLEHIHEIFEEPLIKRSLADMRPSRARARRAEILQGTAEVDAYGQMEDASLGSGGQKPTVEEIENRNA